MEVFDYQKQYADPNDPNKPAEGKAVQFWTILTAKAAFGITGLIVLAWITFG